MRRAALRVLLVLGGVILGLLAAEGVMRLVYRQPAVPMDMERIEARARHFSQVPTRLKGAFNLAVVGDSVVEGVGAPPDQGVADLLGRRLGQTTGLNVRVIRRGRSGANLQQKVELSRDIVKNRVADLVVVVLFSDDLNFGRMVARRGEVIDLLDKRPSWLMRTLVSRSYLVNALWMVWRATVHQTRTQFLTHQERAHMVSMMGELGQQARAANIPLVLSILPASGMALCPPRPEPGSGCNVALLTMDTMAEILREANQAFVDLRFIWADGRPRIPQIELDDMHSGKLGIAVHPNAEGHAMVAEALLPVVRGLVLKQK